MDGMDARQVHTNLMDATPTTVNANSPATAAQLPRIVIVGAGFAGLTCAKALRGAAAQVIIVDARNFHLFQPLLYQVAWWLWGTVHIFFLIGFRNRVAVALNWLWAYTTKQRGAHLITGSGHDD